MDTPKITSASAKGGQTDAKRDDDREPTKEEIIEDLRIALRDVIAGKKMMPALEALDALERRIYGDAKTG